jgi:hypothetical protein
MLNQIENRGDTPVRHRSPALPLARDLVNVRLISIHRRNTSLEIISNCSGSLDVGLYAAPLFTNLTRQGSSQPITHSSRISEPTLLRSDGMLEMGLAYKHP